MSVKSFNSKGFTPQAGIVKQTSNKLPKGMLTNIAIGGVALMLVVLSLRGMTHKEVIPQCSERFGGGTLFGLQAKSGSPVTTADLQARLGGRDWGLHENLKLLALKEGPAPVAMEIALPKLQPKPEDEAQPKSGMGFTWLVPAVAQAHAACLTYNIKLPENFNFGRGGILPGLFGGETAEMPGPNTKGSFYVRNSWGENGIPRGRAMTVVEPAGNGFGIDPEVRPFPLGRWVRIEQEIVLNTLGAEDGILRMWIDGKLQYEDMNFAARGSERAQLRGVIADVHYGVDGTVLNAVPKSTSIQITPFELRWQ